MGYYILINYKSNDQEAEKTLELIKEKAGEGELLKFDVSDAQQVTQVLNTWQENHPNEYIEILVNNAGNPQG